MKRIVYSLISSLVLALTLTACGSGVKLNDVPVEDRTGQATPGGDTSGASGRTRSTMAEARASSTAKLAWLTISDATALSPSPGRTRRGSSNCRPSGRSAG